MIAIPYLGHAAPLRRRPRGNLRAPAPRRSRWNFFLTVAPWRFKGATSSPVNPLAIF